MAAMLGALGLDAWLFLNLKDGMERNLMIELANRIIKHKEILDNNLAVRIANAINKGRGGGF